MRKFVAFFTCKLVLCVTLGLIMLVLTAPVSAQDKSTKELQAQLRLLNQRLAALEKSSNSTSLELASLRGNVQAMQKDDSPAKTNNQIAWWALCVSTTAFVATLISTFALQWKQSVETRKANSEVERTRADLTRQIHEISTATHTEIASVEKDVANTRIEAYERVERERRTHQLVDEWASHETATARAIVWKARKHILSQRNLNEFYESVTWQELIPEKHLLLHHMRIVYFWRRVAVSDLDWDLCKQQLWIPYRDWYNEYFKPGFVDTKEEELVGWKGGKDAFLGLELLLLEDNVTELPPGFRGSFTKSPTPGESDGSGI